MPVRGWGLALWAWAVPWTLCQGGVAMAECSWAHLKLSGCQPSTRQSARDMCGAGKAREACSGRTQGESLEGLCSRQGVYQAGRSAHEVIEWRKFWRRGAV